MRKLKKRLLSAAMALSLLITSLPLHAAPALGAATKDALKPLKLQYTTPATSWSNLALPLGNGHMGAMVFGKTDTERIQMNEKTLWTGGPGGADDAEGGVYETKDPLSDAYGNVDAYKSGAMKKYVDYLFDRFYSGATSSSAPAQSGDMKVLPNNRAALGDYQNFAEMYIDLNHDTPEDYRRELDLRTALSTVSYTSGGVAYTRKMFVNYPSNVMAYQITADRPGSVDLVLRPQIPDLGTKSGQNSKTLTKSGTVVADEEQKTITMEGTIENNGMKFAGKFTVENHGGTVTAENPEDETHPGSKGQLTVAGADSVVIYVTLATNYANHYPDYRQEDADFAIHDVTERMESAAEKGYDGLYKEHLADYQELFSRVELDLGGTYDENTDTAQLRSDWNKAAGSGTQDHYLEELYFQFGRYLLISASRGDTLPSNLQGVWNDSAFPMWQSDYHLNINLQMNYWPAYSANLAELGGSLVDYIDSLQEPGRVTASKLFGTTGDAWMANCSANALGFTGNINSSASLQTTANAFILQNVYDYYQYTGDKDRLKNQIYPMMKGACDFLLQILQKGRTDADKDKLYVAPSYSSEQGPWTIGTTFDQQMVYLLFKDTLEAAGELGISNEFTAQLEDVMKRLYPITIGESGQIKEWQQEGQYNRYANSPSTKIGEDGHRHNSQLIALQPGDMITTETDEWMEAAKKTLTLRGDGASGWSMGQKFNMWARLQDGNHAYKLFKNLMKNGTLDNLFDTCPPFQIDGNYGATEGIAELIMQSHAGYVSLLPALPDEWSQGSVKGIVAEGNFVIDMDWAGRKVTDLQVTSRNGGCLSVKCGAIDSIVDATTGKKITETTQGTNGAVSFDTEKGHIYKITPGEEEALLQIKNYISKVEDMGLVPYMYTSETGDEFEEALVICQRMVEQKNYMVSDVNKTLQRLKAAVGALVFRKGEAYAAAAALRFLEAAAKENYEGTDTEDQWRQSVEYGRADLMEELKYGARDAAEVLQEAENLAETGNMIAGYPAARNNLFDAIKKAVTVSQDTFTEEEWAAYMAEIDSAAAIYADVRATGKDLEAARIQVMDLIEHSRSAYTITVESEGPGAVVPSGKVTVIGGADQQFMMNPEENAEVLDVLVDGKSVGAASSYTMEEVDKDSTLHIIFRTVKETKTEEDYLLDNALARAGSLDKEMYTTASWKAMQSALEGARSTDREDRQKVREKAEALLDAMDALVLWGDAVRVEAEESGLYPVENYDQKAVYGNEENWGEKELAEDGPALIGGYPDGGPVKVGNGGNAHNDGAWNIQTVTGQGKPASNGKELACKTSGAWVKFRFTGNRVRYITETAMVGAGVDVYIDGEKTDELDCFTNSSSIYERNYAAFDSAGHDLILEDGTHELKLVGYQDDKNTSATTNPIFRVDAFDYYPNNTQVVSTKTLAGQVARISAMSAIGKTEDSWSALQEKLEAAEMILNDSNATQESVNAALTELKSAEDSLVAADMTIKEITSLNPVKVPIGTSEAQVREALPGNVVVKIDNGMSFRVNIVWDLNGLHCDKAGEYNLKGALDPEETLELTNPDNLFPEVAVKVVKYKAAITLSNLVQTEGSVAPVTAETDPAGLAVRILYNGGEAVPETAGEYRVEAQIVDDAYAGTAKAVLVISEVVVDPIEEAKKEQEAAEAARKKAEEALKLAEEKAAEAEAARLAAEKAQTESNADAAALKKAWDKARAQADAAAKTAEDYKAQAEKLVRDMINEPTVKLINTAFNKITVTWSKQKEVSGYVIYRAVSKNGTYKEIKTVSNSSTIKYTDSRLTCGKTYYYKVCAYKEIFGSRLYGNYSKDVKLKAVPAQAVISKLKAGKGTATVQMKKQSGISGYVIYRAVKKNGTYKKVKTIKMASKRTFKNSKLSSKKTYYYKVRAYKKVGSKTIYGPYSAVKSVKVK